MERGFLLLLLTASGLTILANTVFGDSDAISYVLAIDLALLGVAFYLCLTSDRFWPMWFAAFHLLGILSLLPSVLFPDMDFASFRMAAAFWAIPALLAFAAGTWKDFKAEVHSSGKYNRSPFSL